MLVHFRWDDVNDTEEPKPENYNDIAWQLVNEEPGKNMNVVIGGGYPAFFPLSMEDDLNNMVC